VQAEPSKGGHDNDYVFNLTLADASGQLHTLGVSGWHKFFSEDCQGWVSASELQDGEHLRGHSGTMNVTSITSLPGLHRVYNFTVGSKLRGHDP
jgi:hypothetical protein